MDLSEVARKLGLSDSELVVRKAAEIRRLCDVQFNSSIIGVGEVCKSVICLEIAATRLGILFDRSGAIRLSGVSERAYTRSYNSLHNSLGVKIKLDVRELAIQFGCVRIIFSVRNSLNLYKDRFLSSLPASRRASADFTRPVFTAVAFYLCAKKQKLKVDKLKLIELCGTSDSEFCNVLTSMKDLCYDVFGIAKEKKDPTEVKSKQDLPDVLPGKRKSEDAGYLSDDGLEISSSKKRKQMEKPDFEDRESSMLTSNNRIRAKVPCKREKQAHLDFLKEALETQVRGYMRFNFIIF